MTKLFLRSGSLDDFLALGENGQPVYASALQLRETLRLRKQQQIADCLAIPQPNEGGDRIDWYAPVEGKITSWIAASEEQRAAALKQLETYQEAVAGISQRAQRAEKPAQQLFGVLLAKAIQFPGPNHVYLVDGKPVLTFWGFVNLDKKSRADALDCLRQVEEEAVPVFAAAPITPPRPQSLDPVVTPESAAKPQAAARSQRLRLWWLFPAAALLAVLSLQIYGWLDQQDKTPEPTPLAATIQPEKRALPASVREPEPQPAAEPEVQEAKSEAASPASPPESAPVERVAATPLTATEPQEAAPAPEAVPEPVIPEPTPVAPPAVVGKEELVMPADAVRLGTVNFLNGNWRVSVDARTPITVTGRPPSLRYQIKNGKGTARITHGDGITCRADIEAGLMSSGNLVINSRYRARCSDNSRFKMPELVCKRSATGIAECTGRYNADAVFPMTIKRESKS